MKKLVFFLVFSKKGFGAFSGGNSFQKLRGLAWEGVPKGFGARMLGGEGFVI